MKFKKAITLAEIMIAMILIGIIVIAMVKIVNPESYRQKSYKAKAQKAIVFMDNALKQILEIEKQKCPMGVFILKPSGVANWEYVCNDTLNDSQEYINLFKEYLKVEKTGFNFCDYSGYCDGQANIKGAKISGNIYIGMEILDSIQDCSDYYLPDDEELIKAPKRLNRTTKLMENAKCWAKLYVDTNGDDLPNELGKDVYIFNLGEVGIER